MALHYIDSLSDLEEMRDKVNAADTTWRTDTYLLRADIQMGVGSWTPIGVHADANHFDGKFYGNNHTISNLFIDAGGSDYQGLFGKIDSNAQITALSLTNVDVTGQRYTGGLLGTNVVGSTSTIVGCSVTGSVAGNGWTGGLCGFLDTGGIVRQSYSTATVSSTGDFTGGLIGYIVNQDVLYCFATGNVTGSGATSDYTGGLIGRIHGASTVKQCYASGDVSGGRYSTGGLAGINYGNSLVENCYARGSVAGVNDNVGGLVSYNDNAGSIVRWCHAVGATSGGGDASETGGMVGKNTETITQSYYNEETTGQTGDTKGVGIATSQAYKLAASFPGFDFENVWYMATDMPKLRNVPDADGDGEENPIESMLVWRSRYRPSGYRSGAFNWRRSYHNAGYK